MCVKVMASFVQHVAALLAVMQRLVPTSMRDLVSEEFKEFFPESVIAMCKVSRVVFRFLCQLPPQAQSNLPRDVLALVVPLCVDYVQTLGAQQLPELGELLPAVASVLREYTLKAGVDIPLDSLSLEDSEDEID